MPEKNERKIETFTIKNINKKIERKRQDLIKSYIFFFKKKT